MAKNTEIVEAKTELEKTPSWLDQKDQTGLEGITAEDVRLPRLAIAQGLSPQVQRGDSQYIEGLGIGDMFNDLTQEVYGPGPLKFIPVMRNERRLEFTPRAEGGGIRDFDVPKGDPRLDWTEGPNGERKPPIATSFTEFVALLVKDDGSTEPIVISLKETNKFTKRAATNLTTLIALKQRAIYSSVYSAKVKTEKNTKGTWGVFVFQPVGGVEKQADGQMLYEQARALYQGLVGKNIIVERETAHVEDNEPVPF
jgi:hypothetical protein